MARGELIDTPSWIRLLAKAVVPRSQRERFRAMLADERRAFERSHGYDVFGAHPDGAAVAHFVTSFLYDHWFRVKSRGHEHIPVDGPVIVAANHSGTLPFDAMMIYADLLRRTDPPRLPRAVADSFVAGLPFIGTLFARGGAVGGARRNVEYLLREGELLLIFPEGVPGISKRFGQRYQLQRFRGGHVELAMKYGASVVPAALVGAEEQMPQIGRLPLRLFGAPFVPIPATPLPLPVRYHLAYGEPIRFERDPAAADDPERIREGAERVRASVQWLVDGLLETRPGVFR